LASNITEYLEVWDYVGGASFRGFIAEKNKTIDKDSDKERTLFLFFEKGVQGTELKHGLVALIDLATDCFECESLVVCLDRQSDGMSKSSLSFLIQFFTT